MKEVLILGGGAAGLMAALFAARNGAHPTIAERNEKLGKKLFITGKGRCNLTNTATGEEFMAHIVMNPRFLYAALANLSSADTVALFESLGMPTIVERGNRVYPASQKASDVTRTLEAEIRARGGRILLAARAKRVLVENGRAVGAVFEDGETIRADAVVLATGGLSYPSTGSTGDGYRFARDVGHTVTDTRPSLVAIETAKSWPGELAGLTLKNVRLTVRVQKKTLFDEQGEMLFTHTGISGPLGLKLSAVLPAACEGTPVYIDLKPALDAETLDARLLRDFQASPNKSVGHVTDGLAPHSLASVILRLAQIAPGVPVHSVTKAERARILSLLKALPMTVKRLRGYEEAVITRGGVSVREIDASTMQSKIVPGLFFAGEMIDVDALTGGYNLQIAFSTGALAGQSAALSYED